MALPRSRFQDLSDATVVRKSLAMEKSVSPRFTRYTSFVSSGSLVSTCGATLLAATTSRERDSVTGGAGESVLEASRSAGARGMIRRWPVLTLALADR